MEKSGMKIQCNGCTVEEATVFCCADEAALCCGCDEKIHAANKLASKHHRVPLSASSSPLPKCDICQETFGYFLCLEDRALLCRKCDVAIHTMNSFVSSHQRFLLTGVKVGLETAMLDESIEKATAYISTSNRKLKYLSRLYPTSSSSKKNGDPVERWSNIVPSNVPVAYEDGNVSNADSHPKGALGSIASYSHNQAPDPVGLISKADGKVNESSEWWKILRSTEEQLFNIDDTSSWAVPELLQPHQDSCSPIETGKLEANYSFNIPHASGLPSGSDF